jgi:hypothetical protein
MKLELTKEELDKLYQDAPMHLETETEFQRVYRMGRNALVLELIEKLTLIELPSDEEIWEAEPTECSGDFDLGVMNGFRMGAQWMRDKIQGGNK